MHRPTHRRESTPSHQSSGPCSRGRCVTTPTATASVQLWLRTSHAYARSSSAGVSSRDSPRTKPPRGVWPTQRTHRTAPCSPVDLALAHITHQRTSRQGGLTHGASHVFALCRGFGLALFACFRLSQHGMKDHARAADLAAITRIGHTLIRLLWGALTARGCALNVWWLDANDWSMHPHLCLADEQNTPCQLSDSPARWAYALEPVVYGLWGIFHGAVSAMAAPPLVPRLRLASASCPLNTAGVLDAATATGGVRTAGASLCHGIERPLSR